MLRPTKCEPRAINLNTGPVSGEKHACVVSGGQPEHITDRSALFVMALFRRHGFFDNSPWSIVWLEQCRFC